MSPYGWVITIDKISGEEGETFTTPGEKNDVGVMGPRDIPEAMAAALQAGEGLSFRMLDDDGIVYYHGRYLKDGDTPGDLSEDAFGPLDDYGTIHAGCVVIQYYRDHRWETL